MNNNYNVNNSNKNNRNNDDFDLNNLNNMISNVNQNIQNIEDRFNNPNIKKNNNNDDFIKKTDFNMNKIGFYNNGLQPTDFENNNYSNNNRMEIDDEYKKQNSNNNNNFNNNFNDQQIMNDINEKHTDIKKILFLRKNTLKRLAKFCIDKDIPSTLNYLLMINELAVFNDFLNYSLIQTDTIRVPLTMDNASFLLSHVADLVNSKYENYKKVGIHSALKLLKLFSERIITTKGSLTVGIDLSKEDRIKKCDKIIDFYKTFKDLHSFESILNKKYPEEVRINSIINHYLFYIYKHHLLMFLFSYTNCQKS